MLSILTLLSLLITYATATASQENVKEFDLSITWQDYAPDGFSRPMLLFNGQSPGPTLEFDQDDQVVVRVHNYSPYNTTVHFHGLEMRDTPWSDGVPGVTQRPIHPDSSFVYKFEATQHGSYWYHSHSRGQIEDGLYGPIVIHPRPEDPKPFHLITDDYATRCAMEAAAKEVVPLIISDFVHVTSDAKWEMTLEAGFEDSCYDSILFNGKGKVDCLSEEQIASNLNDIQKTYLEIVPGSKFTDKGCLPPSILLALGGATKLDTSPLGKTFSGCNNTEGPIEVIKASLQDTEEAWIALDVIAAVNFFSGIFSIDEHDLWVYGMDGSYIEPQKVQAIPLTNGDRYSVLVRVHKKGNFNVRFSSNVALQILSGYAVLSVGEGGSTEESGRFVDLVGLPLSKDVVFFDQTKAYPFPPDPPSPTADALYSLSMKLDGATYLWVLNSSRLMPHDLDVRTPVLFNPNPNLNDNVTISTKHNDWIDLVFVADSFPQPPHPIHKHGTKMYHIGSGTGAFRWKSVEEAIKEIPDQFNLVNPPRRDAFSSLPAEKDVSWVVVRYHAINPGPWLLHCHIQNHMMGGMMMVIQDGVDRWPTVPEEYAGY